jgi:hypothetical protein
VLRYAPLARSAISTCVPVRPEPDHIIELDAAEGVHFADRCLVGGEED